MGFLNEIGSAIFNFVSGGIAEIVETSVKLLRVVAEVIEGLAKKLGIIESEEETEDIGDRALQAEADGYKLEDFDNYDEYMKFLRNFELDPEKSKKIEEDEKLAKGLDVITKKIEDQFDLKMDKFLVEVAKNIEFYNPKRIETYLEKFSESGLDLNDIIDTGKDFDKDIKVDQVRVEVEQQLNPNMSKGEIIDMLLEEK
ncbi:MAG: hypothetical protein ACOCRK_01465 [bacterium]